MTNQSESEKPKARRRRGLSSFEQLTKKPHGAFHPSQTKIWRWSDSEYAHNCDGVDEYSDMVVFAWEFLRRNRYYMALVDGRKSSIAESEWGYQWHKKADRTHGLIELKDFREKYTEGNPPRWQGLDSFAEHIQKHPMVTETSNIELTLLPGQIAVVLDLGNRLQASPWREQVFSLQDFLEKLSPTSMYNNGKKGKSKHKAVLLRRLRMIDGISRGLTIEQAGRIAYSQHQQHLKTHKSIKATFIDGLNRDEDKNPLFYEDLEEAFQLVYKHGYLKLAGGDGIYRIDGNRLRPITSEELSVKQGQSANTMKTVKSRIHRAE